MQKPSSDAAARNIRRLASERGISLNRLADFAGVSQAQMYNVLAGKKSPTLKWLDKIAAVLEVSVADLVAD